MTPTTGHAAISADSLGKAPARLLTPSELADFLGVSREYVYEHAVDLGAWRLGDGRRARLRFDLEEVRRRLTACPTGRESDPASGRMVEPKQRRRSRASSGSEAQLLPIRGRGPREGDRS